MSKAKVIKKKTIEPTAEKINEILIKKANGYISSEIIEEYQVDDDKSMKLVKRKVTTKDIPSDMSAMKLLFELNKNIKSDDYIDFSDEELELEKNRLIKLLKNEEKKV